MNTAARRLESVRETVERALAEDRAGEDATSRAVVLESTAAIGTLLARQDGVLSGMEFAAAAFTHCDPAVQLEWKVEEGGRLVAGEIVLACRGLARGLLGAERVALNFLQHLSGIASLTARAVAGAGRLQVMETRKTTPGLRDAEKAAVRAGGGVNQRRDLEEELLLKENHFAVSGSGYRETVSRARAASPGRVLGVEARSFAEARAALDEGADYVLLDNFEAGTLAEAVKSLKQEFPSAVLEASGGIDPLDLGSVAAAGLDRVSLGALTHSAPSLDFSFLLQPDPDRTS